METLEFVRIVDMLRMQTKEVVVRAKVAKKLARAAHKMAPAKKNEHVDFLTRVFRIKSDVQVDWYTRRYRLESPRSIYQRLKQQWHRTPRPLREKVSL